MNNKLQKIVTIGGGSGQYVLLSGLRDFSDIDITAIVSMVDSGGSTGRLRDEYGILPPGDILKCVLALSPNRDSAREILQKRIKGKGRLDGHNAGNLLLTILQLNNAPFFTVSFIFLLKWGQAFEIWPPTTIISGLSVLIMLVIPIPK